MTAPALTPFITQERGRRANWLGRLMNVNRDLEKDLRKALREAGIAVDNRFSEKRFAGLKSAEAQRVQIALAHNEIRAEIKDLFGNTEGIIYARKQDAAVAAVNAGLYDERALVAKIFDDPKDRVIYADSLRATARRDVEAMETRVLSTKIPLSEQVWKSAVLARGQVDTIVNNALAQGKGYRDIADEVKHLINPDTPGGVSFAAFRLGRSEINNAYHAQSVYDAMTEPWIDFMRWNLGMNHVVPDECDEWDQALFPTNQVPELPHPNCWCYVVPEMPDWDTFAQNLDMGTYDDYLDAVMAGTESEWTSAQLGMPSAPEYPYTPESKLVEIPFNPPDSKNVRLMIDLPEDDGRWLYREIEVDGSYHNFEKIPAAYPEKATFTNKLGKETTVYYDPKVSIPVKDDSYQGYSNPLSENKISDLKPPEGLIWRGMSKEEYEISVARGYFESTGSYNVGGESQAGKTYFSTSTDQASNYATWFAPPEYKPTFDHPAYVIGIPDDPKLLREQGTEVGVPGKISIKSVNQVYEARPFEITPGSQGAQRTWSDDWEKAGGSQANIKVYWRETAIAQRSEISRPPADVLGLQTGPTIIPPDTPEMIAAKQQRIEDAVTRIKAAHGSEMASVYGYERQDPRVLEEMASAVENMSAKYPEAKMYRLGFGDVGDDYAVTYLSDARTSGKGTVDGMTLDVNNGFYSRVVFNENGGSYERWKEFQQRDEDSRWHTVGSAEKPVLSTFNHEFGHVIVNSLGKDFDWVDDRITTREVTAAAKEVWKNDPETWKAGTTLSFKDYTKQKLSRYSFRDYLKGYLDKDEALAEAFDVVERGKGNPVEQALHRLLSERYYKRYGRP